jgi:hypothetical protein
MTDPYFSQTMFYRFKSSLQTFYGRHRELVDRFHFFFYDFLQDLTIGFGFMVYGV